MYCYLEDIPQIRLIDLTNQERKELVEAYLRMLKIKWCKTK